MGQASKIKKPFENIFFTRFPIFKMAHFSDRRRTEEPKRNDLAAFTNLSRAWDAALTDSAFTDYLRSSRVQRALQHWTGQSRLSPSEAEKLQEDEVVMRVFRRVSVLQRLCKVVQVKFPLSALMNGKNPFQSKKKPPKKDNQMSDLKIRPTMKLPEKKAPD